MIVTIIPRNLVANSLLSFFLFFHGNQNSESDFQQAVGLVTRNSFTFYFYRVAKSSS